MDPVKTVVDSAAKFAKVPEDNADAIAAGEGFAKAARTLATTINNALLPIAALNYGIAKARAYFEERFGKDVEEKLKDIPQEHIVDPKPSIVGPALQGLAFSLEEDELKDLYLRLIASAMNSATASRVHPSFVEIIRQLGGEEASYLKALLSSAKQFRVASIGIKRIGEYEHVTGNVLNVYDTEGPLTHPDLAVWVDNWIRLGIFTIDVTKEPPFANSWVKQRREYKDVAARAAESGGYPETRGGLLFQTDFGIRFAKAVGIVDPPMQDH